jgi:hypothetical protein
VASPSVEEKRPMKKGAAVLLLEFLRCAQRGYFTIFSRG